MNKVPPHNIEAEKSVIGAVLLDNKIFDQIVDIIAPNDFYKNSHRIIFKAFLNLYNQREPIDILTVTDFLQRNKQLEEIGGASYLSEIMDSVPTSANALYYAKIVKDKALLRQIIETSTGVIEESYEQPENIEEFIDKVEKRFFELSEKRFKATFSDLTTIIKEAVSTIEHLYASKSIVSGVPSGFIDLDRKLNGFHKSDLIIVAGRPSMGKTALCLNIAHYVAVRKKIPVAFFSLEMSKEQLGFRLLSQETGIPSNVLRNGLIAREQWGKITEAAGVLSEGKLFIDDTPAMSILEIRSKARRLKSQEDIQLIIVDYLQLIRGFEDRDSREREISEISRFLKNLARELNIPVIALSQLNRAVEQRANKRPQLSDLRESGAIEQDADVIIFIYRDEVYNKETKDKGIAEIIIGKHRNGPTGTVLLKFNSDTTTFENLAPEYYQDMVEEEFENNFEDINPF